MDKPDKDKRDEPSERPWIALNTTYDVEAWIDIYNRDLQRSVGDKIENGVGICFCLAAGGEIFMHTTSEGDVLLDVTPEAEWVTPVITAATQVEQPHARIWNLPAHALTQLVLGLSSLIGTSRIVHRHEYKIKRYS